jgi:hypothetical protein
MPTLTRLLLSVSSVADGSTLSTHVFDTSTTQRQVCALWAARSALLGVTRPGVPAPLRERAAALLGDAQFALGTGVACGDVSLQEHGLKLEEAREWQGVQEGAATFLACGQALPTRLRGVRAVAEVAALGLALEVVALVHANAKTGAEGLARPALHFVGASGGALLNVRTLGLNKRSHADAGAAGAGPGASHFLRRGWQLQAHAAAMQDLGCAVDAARTRRCHTLLVDAYVSQAEHEGRALQCVSLFV